MCVRLTISLCVHIFWVLMWTAARCYCYCDANGPKCMCEWCCCVWAPCARRLIVCKRRARGSVREIYAAPKQQSKQSKCLQKCCTIVNGHRTLFWWIYWLGNCERASKWNEQTNHWKIIIINEILFNRIVGRSVDSLLLFFFFFFFVRSRSIGIAILFLDPLTITFFSFFVFFFHSLLK